MPSKKALFFDTVVLSNFALIPEGISFLRKRYHSRGHVTLQVLQEIAKATYAGLNQLDVIENTLFQKGGFIKCSLTESEQTQYIQLLRNLGEGEASCIAAGVHRKAVVVTDDRVARNFCKELNCDVTGTIGILKASCLDATLHAKDADLMLKQMIACGFYSPIQKVSDIL